MSIYIDSKELVFCKECKHRRNPAICHKIIKVTDKRMEDFSWHIENSGEVYECFIDRTTDDGFCEKGERREE